MNDENLATTLSTQIHISIALIGMTRRISEEPIILVKTCDIPPEKAQKTVKAITQRGIRTLLYPSLLRWFRVSDKNLCCHHLAHPVFLDMLFASTVSRRGNKCAQEYVTDFGWARAFPRAFRSEAHNTLLLLVSRDGVLPACICNNAKQMIQGKFY